MAQPDPDRRQISINASPWLQLQRAYQANLERVKKYRRNQVMPPRCYFSHLPEQIVLAEKLSHDLQHAGVVIIKQATDVLDLSDRVIVLDTQAYKRAFQSHDPILTIDAQLVHSRLGRTGRTGQLIALSVEGETKAHGFETCEPGRVSDETHYLVGLYDLVLDLYAIPLTHAHFVPRRQELHTLWEQTLVQKKSNDDTSTLKLFISYSHQDEEFKAELMTMLAGLQQQRIVDVWQDGRIAGGDEWSPAIQDAMNECDLAILLVSSHFIESRFIQEKELPYLLQRRQQHGLPLVPIIIRPCKWQSEPSLKDLQALPRDNNAVITFSKTDGARERVWVEIVTAIEERAKGKLAPYA
ncbi:MAG TPA: toll/interleukin-1 receptor domain-containing protein [Pyrinomonadaceae bacterium]